MFNHRLIAVVTALTLMGGTSAHADYTLEQLLRIEGYITAKNCAGLWNYVRSNPEVTRGTDPLANELRVFVAATERGQLDCFSARSSSAPEFRPTLDPLPY